MCCVDTSRRVRKPAEKQLQVTKDGNVASVVRSRAPHICAKPPASSSITTKWESICREKVMLIIAFAISFPGPPLTLILLFRCRRQFYQNSSSRPRSPSFKDDSHQECLKRSYFTLDMMRGLCSFGPTHYENAWCMHDMHVRTIVVTC